MRIFRLFLLLLLINNLNALNISGCFKEDSQYLCFSGDSTVDFGLWIDRSDQFAFYREGVGKWKIKKDFLIINILSSHPPRVEVSSSFSDTIKIFDYDGDPIFMADCLFLNDNDSIIGGATSDNEGFIPITQPGIDSITLFALSFEVLGFKVNKELGYKVSMVPFDYINKGQIGFKITKINPNSLSLKYLFYNDMIQVTKKKFLRQLQFQSFFTSASYNYLEFQKVKTSANKK
jgi:hypothetical protein